MPDHPDLATLQTWLTIKEASQAYGVSVAQIRHWMLEGEVPSGQLPTSSGWVWRICPPASEDGSVLAQSAPHEEARLVALQAEVARLHAALRACEEAQRTPQEEPSIDANP